MLRKILCVIIPCIANMLLLHAYSLAQHPPSDIDSLVKRADMQGEDSSRVQILNNISWLFYKQGDVDSSAIYTQKALQLAQRIHYKPGIAKAYSSLGNINLAKADYPKALEYLQISLQMREELKDIKALTALYSSIGLVYYQQSIFPKALSYFFKALKIDIANNDSLYISQDYRDIAMVYLDDKDYDNAFLYNNKALEIQKAIKDSINLSITYNNIGAGYSFLKQYDKALENYQQALKIIQETNWDNKLAQAYYYNNIGVNYKNVQDYTAAYDNLNHAISLYKAVGDKHGIASVYYDIGDLFLLQHKIYESKSILEKALSLAKESPNLTLLMNIHYNLSRVDSIMDNYKEALLHYQRYSSYKDSVYNENNSKEIVRLQMNYEFSQKEDSITMAGQKEVAIREARLSEHRTQQWLMAAGIALLGVIGALLFYQNRIQHKNNVELSKLNTALDEKAKQNILLVKEMHHRIKNNLYMVYSLLKIQSHNTENEETRQQLEAARQRIESIASTHEQLFQNKPGNVSMQMYVSTFVNSSLEQFASFKNVIAHIDIEPEIHLNTVTCMPLAMLINEWLTNSLKYSAGQEDLHIHILGKVMSDGNISVEYYDNGINASQHIAAGVGMRIIHLLSRQIQAELDTNYKNQPYHYHIIFPI